MEDEWGHWWRCCGQTALECSCSNPSPPRAQHLLPMLEPVVPTSYWHTAQRMPKMNGEGFIGAEGLRALGGLPDDGYLRRVLRGKLRVCEVDLRPGAVGPYCDAVTPLVGQALMALRIRLSRAAQCPEAHAHIAALVGRCPHLRVLSLGDCTDEGVSLALRSATTPLLTTLSLRCQSLAPTGLAALVDFLHRVPHLSELTLDGCKLGVVGARGIAAALPHVPALTVLRLNWTGLGPSGAAAIASALPRVPSLVLLGLGVNGLGPAGSAFVAAALPGVPLLTQLDLSQNEVGDAGAEALSCHLASIPQLKYMDLSRNLMSEGGVEAVRAAAEASAPGLKLSLYNQENVEEEEY